MKCQLEYEGIFFDILNAMSIQHAITLAYDKYEKLGLIGKAYLHCDSGYYCVINS